MVSVLYRGLVLIETCPVSENIAEDGGAIGALMFFDVTIDSCSILNNTAVVGGGGVFFYEGERAGIYNSNITSKHHCRICRC